MFVKAEKDTEEGEITAIKNIKTQNLLVHFCKISILIVWCPVVDLLM